MVTSVTLQHTVSQPIIKIDVCHVGWIFDIQNSNKGHQIQIVVIVRGIQGAGPPVYNMGSSTVFNLPKVVANDSLSSEIEKILRTIHKFFPYDNSAASYFSLFNIHHGMLMYRYGDMININIGCIRFFVSFLMWL